MKYKIKQQVRIREEENFYLIVNLTTEDMLSGYPAFFKTNTLGKSIIESISDYSPIDRIVECLIAKYPKVNENRINDEVKHFIEILERYSLVEKEN